MKMVEVRREGIILKPTKLGFENKGVINPGCIQVGNDVHIYYRAWSKKKRSTIGYCRLEGPLNVVERWSKPLLSSESPIEFNLEDPRVVIMDGTYYMTYIAYDNKNVRIAYATSNDPINWKKKGIISPEITYDEAEDLFRACRLKLKERYFLFESYFKDKVDKDVIIWDKDAFLFPKKIDGKFALVHRVLPDIQVVYFKKFEHLTLKFWKNYFRNLNKYVVLESEHWFETRNIGGGCPPIETDKGWLLIYHAVDDMDRGKIYRAGAALLDKNNPTKVISHLEEPLLSPETWYEKDGNINNVVFPTGYAIFNERLYIYYGASDKYIAACSLKLKDLVSELYRNRRKPHF